MPKEFVLAVSLLTQQLGYTEGALVTDCLPITMRKDAESACLSVGRLTEDLTVNTRIFFFPLKSL